MPIKHFNCCLLEIPFSNFSLCSMWTTLDPVHDGVVIRASLNLHMAFIIHAILKKILILDLMIRFGFDFPPLYLKFLDAMERPQNTMRSSFAQILICISQ